MLKQPKWLLVTMTNSHITIGIDEVGRGPWAGPLVVSAVALDMTRPYEGLKDSKQLTPRQRQRLDPYIKSLALGIGTGWVDAPVLDKLGMTKSLQLAANLAYRQLPEIIRDQADRIVIDGNLAMITDDRVLVIPKADAKVQAVSAASIVAKVARDSYMTELAKLYPDYGFASHMGYGTKAHKAVLLELGPIEGLHRFSFRPIAELIHGATIKPKVDRVSHTAGRQAESAAADYLGYQVIERNWRTPRCEIDIIAKRRSTLYFVEVKYRENDQYGDGLMAITPQKLAQMKFAARCYLQAHLAVREHCDVQLLALAMHDNPPAVDQLVVIDE